MSNTKTELEAENARLRDENEALRELLAAIGEGHPPLPLDDGKMHVWFRECSSRLSVATIAAERGAVYRDEYTVRVLRDKAEHLRKQWKRPLHYVPETPVLEGTVTAPPQDAPYAEVICGVALDRSQSVTCGLPPGHDEDYHVRETGEVRYHWPRQASEFADETAPAGAR